VPQSAAELLFEPGVDGRSDSLGARVQLGRQAANRDVRPAAQPDDREHLTRDRAAREHQDFGPLGLEDRLVVRTESKLLHGVP
jgi:hypothetical protein